MDVSKDRRILQARRLTPNVVVLVDELTPDVIVSADGSGTYMTIMDAVNNAPSGVTSRYIMKIKVGVYRETMVVPSSKTNIMFLGDGSEQTIIARNKNKVDDGSTFYFVIIGIKAKGFLAQDITFEKIFGSSKEQAVALQVDSD
ncbi:hypothetical protein JCGZ_00056 [Jatropha curcas]|uniref:Pectinesterase catalytic domain-containing protein n=1 Tax=Jatropha curcas TaxID=180498 RepID=A0A067LQF5_JATCU|nr:hypothetical protein JCGZ_00056 [Jatropha curcas]